MSELKDFKSSDDFRQQLKKFLLKERNMKAQNQEAVVTTQRYSFEIQADLKKTIDEKLSQSGRKLQKTVRKSIENIPDCNDDNDNDDDVGNDSFMALEMMCNKTASDPESTLFQYMHSDCKEDVLANVKQRHSKEQQEDEESAEQLLFAFDAKMLNGNETQLADIEEPSKFWEHTIVSGNSILTTSPVKMIGMLRPSTIMEEKDEDYSQNSTAIMSHTTNENKNVLSTTTTTTSNYETAADTTSSTQTKCEMPYYSLESLESPKCEEDSESVIEILSDDENTMGGKIPESIDHINTEISELLNISGSTYNPGDDFDKENCATSINLPDENKNISREFNDTMEEVEYMMKKGMEIMAGAAKQQQQQLLAEEIQPKALNENNFNKITKSPITPNRHDLLVSSNIKKSPMPNKFKVKANEFSASKISSPPPFVVKPVPKFEMKFNSNEYNNSIFKRPMPGSATKTPIPNSQQLRKPKQFDHIVSPIGMYVKNTKNTPLMTNMHSKSHQSNDLMNTTAFRNLEKVDFTDSQQTVKAAPSGILPKKAYISSKYKHMVDKRTPISVPGGNSIQQYIQPALVPTVVRHEGKMHLNPMASQKSQAQRNVDDSLKDLSIMSGDVSLLTIKSALHIQKK